MNKSIETLREAIDGYGLGYAIETGTLSHKDVRDEHVSELIKTAYEAMKEMKEIARS